MAVRSNLDNAVLAVTRVGSFSEGEKDALIKALRLMGFPGDWLITNPTTNQVLRYDGTNWVNSAGGATAFTQLTDTPGTITANGFVKGNSGGTALEQVTNVAEVDAAETISGAWTFEIRPTVVIGGGPTYGDMLLTTDSINTLADVDTTGKLSGDFLRWDGANWSDYTLTFDALSPMTTAEDMIVGGTAGAAARLPVGTNGQVLTVTGGAIDWATPASGFADPMTTRGDIIVRNAANTTARLAIGTTGKYLKSDGTDISWTAPAFADTTPMTTNEDIIKQSGGVAARLPVGTNNQVLTVTAGVVGWATPAAGFADPMTTRGDMIFRDATNTTARKAVGTVGQVLTSDGTDFGWAAASSGTTLFTGLTDTPSTYVGQGLKWVRVNTGATALEFVATPVTTVTASTPLASSGGATPNITLQAASSVANGYMSSTFWSKLNAIESGADVTDAGNVAAAGAVMDGDYVANGYQVRLGAGSYTSRTLTATTPMAVTNGDGSTGNPVISVAAASDTASGVVELATVAETNTGTDATRAVTPAGLEGWTGSTAVTTLGTISGTLSATAFNATSDRDKKTQVGNYINPDAIKNLKPIQYTLKDAPEAGVQIGYFADEMALVYPEIVGYKDSKPVSIDYSRLVVPLIEKIKQLEARLEAAGL